MGKPKCPKCETSEFVVLINTGEKVGTGVGAIAGGIVGKKTGEIIDNSRSLYQCNKCNNEFNG